MPAAGILAGKGANIGNLFCTTPKVLKLHESQFWNVLKILGKESTRGGPPIVHEGGGRALPPGSAPYLMAASWTPPNLFPTTKPHIYAETPRTQPRSGVPPPQASVATKNQSRPVLAPCQRGGSLSGGHLHHSGALHDE